jgi:hypothetical protein
MITKRQNRGGSRAGSGRKKGVPNKITGVHFLEEYRKVHGEDLVKHLAEDMFDARKRGDRDLLYKYQSTFARYFFSEMASQDITSGGKPLATQVVLVSKELPDWSDKSGE